MYIFDLGVSIPDGRTHAHAQVQKFLVTVIDTVLLPHPEEFKS
jgi:hypothetical protein